MSPKAGKPAKPVKVALPSPEDALSAAATRVQLAHVALRAAKDEVIESQRLFQKLKYAK